MAEKKLVSVQVGADQKEKWTAHVEESDRFNSLSDLIRAAVESEIAGGEDESQPVVPEVSGDLDQLKNDLDRVRKDVRWLKNQATDDRDIAELANTVFRELREIERSNIDSKPPDESSELSLQEEDFRDAVATIVADGSADDPEPQTLSALADRVGAEETDVRDAIEHLEESMMPIVEVEINGETHYFKEK